MNSKARYQEVEKQDEMGSGGVWFRMKALSDECLPKFNSCAVSRPERVGLVTQRKSRGRKRG